MDEEKVMPRIDALNTDIQRVLAVIGETQRLVLATASSNDGRADDFNDKVQVLIEIVFAALRMAKVAMDDDAKYLQELKTFAGGLVLTDAQHVFMQPLLDRLMDQQ